MKTFKILAIISAAIFLLCAPALALQSTFFGEDLGWYNPATNTKGSAANSEAAQAEFLSNLTGVGTETFESFDVGTGAPLTLDFGVAGTATISGVGAVQNSTNQEPVGRVAYSGDRFYETNTGEFTVTFSQAIAAFGFFGIDFGDFSGQITAELTNGETAVYDIPHSQGSIANGALLYWGIIDTENLFTSVTLSNTGSSIDFFGFDDLTIGSLEQVSVPEPATLLWLGTSLLGLAALRRKISK